MATRQTHGKKLDRSPHVMQITKMLYENIPDAQIIRLLEERYNFKVSIPSLSGFRKNYYNIRLSEFHSASKEHKQQERSKIETFIDESLSQAASIKLSVDQLEKHISIIENDLNFTQKFDTAFKNAVNAYIDDFDEEQPRKFIEEEPTLEEQKLQKIKEYMGSDAHALTMYTDTHNPVATIKLLTLLHKNLLDQRNSLVKIHQNIFKGYKNHSIMQELTFIFEEYNGIIIEEFFPKKDKVDPAKYQLVRKKILSLFDKLQIRYQGVESPSDNMSTKNVDVVKEVENIKKNGVKTPMAAAPKILKQTKIEATRERFATASNAGVRKAPQPQFDEDMTTDQITEEANKIEQRAAHHSKFGDIFSSIKPTHDLNTNMPDPLDTNNLPGGTIPPPPSDRE